MSDAAPQPIAPAGSDVRTLAIVVYVLYIAAVFTCGLAGVAGVILAYIKRDETAGTIWHSHFENQIQAFWVWFMLFVVGCVTWWLFFIGFLVIGVAFLYFLYRTIKGLVAAVENQPYVP
ncbi:MAG TPA: hypothetical protein VG387_17870 [Rhizomicrobium sp.]|jgi:uncharacterized membrane protein|nr:hypothetical protein [Rhizomicrobium sp.]